MKNASYILNAYSFIKNQTIENLIKIGNQSRNGQPIPSFDEKILIGLCLEAQETFKKENNILKIDGNIIIVGDIHGNLHDLLRIIKFWYESGSKILFLGDYVDKGDYSIECITILFAIKILYPDSFYLIRGNHEFNSLCTQYGFKNDILNYHHLNNLKSRSNAFKKTKQKIPKFFKTFSESSQNSDETQLHRYTEALYNSFINSFSYMPICAIVNKTTFCVHGGLSPKLNDINDLNIQIKRPIHQFKESPLLGDILWSDPQEDLNLLFGENSKRGQGFSFNGEAVNIFLKKNSLSRIIRSHQYVKRGLQKNFNNKCITVFSSSLNNNDSFSVLQLFQKDDKFKVKTFLPVQHLNRSEAIFSKIQCLNQNEEENKNDIKIL